MAKNTRHALQVAEPASTSVLTTLQYRHLHDRLAALHSKKSQDIQRQRYPTPKSVQIAQKVVEKYHHGVSKMISIRTIHLARQVKSVRDQLLFMPPIAAKKVVDELEKKLNKEIPATKRKRR